MVPPREGDDARVATDGRDHVPHRLAGRHRHGRQEALGKAGAVGRRQPARLARVLAAHHLRVHKPGADGRHAHARPLERAAQPLPIGASPDLAGGVRDARGVSARAGRGHRGHDDELAVAACNHPLHRRAHSVDDAHDVGRVYGARLVPQGAATRHIRLGAARVRDDQVERRVLVCGGHDGRHHFCIRHVRGGGDYHSSARLAVNLDGVQFGHPPRRQHEADAWLCVLTSELRTNAAAGARDQDRGWRAKRSALRARLKDSRHLPISE
mmetsp:Transcript_33248/g.109931  ORF Transcript_33248/g.109931 Transcript_33248/m.109931 type:complete len:268 (+) Transcript_33248:390-1193(+)